MTYLETILIKKIEKLHELGIALSLEDNPDLLLEKILLGAMDLTHANAGTLYLLTDDNTLKMETLRNDELGLAMGGSTNEKVPFMPIPLYQTSGAQNLNNVVTCAVLEHKTINIDDAYSADGFDFSGTREMDKKTGYRSKSFLTVPLKNHEHKIIGVLQLLNAIDQKDGSVVSFSLHDQRLAESLASQAAVTITNKQLINQQKVLFEDFIKLIAKAIDEKSPYTGGHCSRVPVIAMMLADAVNETSHGALGQFKFSDDELYELKIASWLHDCGKVATPQYVMDKGTKLEAIYDRISEVNLRFEIIKRDEKLIKFGNIIKILEADHYNNEAIQKLENDYEKKVNQIEVDKAYLAKVNIGGEFLSESDQRKIETIAETYQWQDEHKQVQSVLEDDQVKNLQVSRGTLNEEEREIINNHVVVTLKMLESLHYPDALKNVPEIAGSHHERIDGKGYPRQLGGEVMSTQAKILAIADVFEALTAADRPYKKAKPLSESLKILGFMAKEGHIDPNLFDVFIRKKLYLDYARDYLSEEQLDSVDEDNIPSYIP